MQFVWDNNKNKINKIKHGLRFENASYVFQDPYLVTISDHLNSDYEERWKTYGLIDELLICVSHTIEENEHGEEIIRIISARGASPSETRRYYHDRGNACRIKSPQTSEN